MKVIGDLIEEVTAIGIGYTSKDEATRGFWHRERPNALASLVTALNTLSSEYLRDMDPVERVGTEPPADNRRPEVKGATLDGRTDKGFLPAVEIAKKYQIPLNALRGRLKRWVQTHEGKPTPGYVEDGSPKPGEPRYLYQVSAVWAQIEDLAGKATTTE